MLTRSSIAHCFFLFLFLLVILGISLFFQTQINKLSFTQSSKTKIIVVYNAFINTARPNWIDLIRVQLENIVENGLASRANQVFVALSTNIASETNAKVASDVKYAVQTVREIIPKAYIEITLENRYEYAGIRLAWDIGQRVSDKDLNNTIILYFHSKGMVYTWGETLGYQTVRVAMELRLFKAVINPWRRIISRFEQSPVINKAGYAASPKGYLWYNFWWARASYIRNLVPPHIFNQTYDDRYYYEGWLCLVDDYKLWPTVHSISFPIPLKRGRPSGANDTLSLCRPDLPLGATFTPQTMPY